MITTTARLGPAIRLLLGLLLLAAIVGWLAPDPADRQALLARVHLAPAYLLLGLGATTLTSLVTSARWRRISEDAMGGTPLPYLVYFHALVLTRVLGQVSSTLAMDLVGRGLALQRAGARHGLGHSVTQAVLERIFDLLLPLVMLLWALACWRPDVSATLALAGFIAVCLGFAALATLALAPLTRLALRCPAPAPDPPEPTARTPRARSCRPSGPIRRARARRAASPRRCGRACPRAWSAACRRRPAPRPRRAAGPARSCRASRRWTG